MLMNHGRVLKIVRATSSDMGRYKCSAGNAVGITAGEITLVLRVPPTIIIPLSDRLVSSESEFSLECPLSSADMQSSVEWFKDAKPVVPLLMPPEQRKRFNVDHNMFVISAVNECVACMSRPLCRRIQTLPCIYQASPRGHVRWSDEGGTKLPHQGRVRENRGILTIEQVLDDDAGLFFCSVNNRLGKAHAHIRLIVMDRPKVRVNSDRKFTTEGSVNITCEVELNCETTMDCPEALFEWTLDDLPLTGIPYKEYFKTKKYEEISKFKDKHMQILYITCVRGTHYGQKAIMCRPFQKRPKLSYSPPEGKVGEERSDKDIDSGLPQKPNRKTNPPENLHFLKSSGLCVVRRRNLPLARVLRVIHNSRGLHLKLRRALAGCRHKTDLHTLLITKH
uniref:Ig-like domain-containing protein n=1 Tax=Heterorhabditis bacteriophora TaxID=37862 RepID=A0A1I7XRD3_HETBA